MRRRLSLVIAFIGVLGFIGFTPTADAAHDIKTKDGEHENSPSPPDPVVTPESGVCPVTGEVSIDNSNGDGGVPAPQDPLGGTKNHNHFVFENVQIQCVGGPVPGAADVRAAGGTDGPGECDGMPGKDPKCKNLHGEDLSAGWSHSSCYNNAISKGNGDCDSMKTGGGKNVDDIYDGTNNNPPQTTQCNNCGEIWVNATAAGQTSCQNITAQNILDNSSDSLDCENFVKFCRGVYNDDVNANGVSDIEEAGGTCSNQFQGGSNVSAGGGNVLAWGALQDWSGKPANFVVCFFAELELVPRSENEPLEKVDKAALAGTAFTWQVTDKDACDGKKNPAKAPTNQVTPTTLP